MSKKKGNIAEDLACEFLENNGFKIVERNFYSKFGEIDIIVQKDKVLHFIEVKSGENFEPIYNITFKKLEKIIKTINYFLMIKNITMPYQIDAVIVNEKIEIVENITF
ncbi:YraN family protein [Nitrosophilus kaiyonis]|uniref:YraN family protein n=1 Tax=Nitrosophilus kaiyonis TaxID=2930200 RepID=UPI00248FEC66|nr:YraN family protein [Nitrosophilus kaiyonis]